MPGPSALAKQIEEGAPADVFISADLDWMKYLSDKNLTKKDTETKLLGNSHRARSRQQGLRPLTVELEAGHFDLAAALVGDGKLAMG
jgi:molybdate transport system substrate-binding protein